MRPSLRIVIDRQSLKQSLESWIVALLVCTKLYVVFITTNHLLPFSAGIFMTGCVWALLILYFVINGIRFDVKVLLFFLFIGLFFLVSNRISSGHVKELTISFLQYGLLALLISTMDFEIERTLRYIAYLFLLVAYPYYQIVHYDLTQTWKAVITMDHSYALLPALMSVLLHLLCYRKKRNVFILLSYIVSLVFLLFVCFKGTRGALLCVITLFVLVYLNSDRSRARQRSAGIILLMILLLLVLLIVGPFLSTMDTNQIGFNAIAKTLRLIRNTGDFTNGRMLHYRFALRDFAESPIVGNGIGVFADRYPAMGYPHNIVCQVLFEGGLLLGLPIIILLIRSFLAVMHLQIRDANERNMLILFFSASVPAAMLSSELWVYPLLWILFGRIIWKWQRLKNKGVLADENPNRQLQRVLSE